MSTFANAPEGPKARAASAMPRRIEHRKSMSSTRPYARNTRSTAAYSQLDVSCVIGSSARRFSFHAGHMAAVKFVWEMLLIPAATADWRQLLGSLNTHGSQKSAGLVLYCSSCGRITYGLKSVPSGHAYSMNVTLSRPRVSTGITAALKLKNTRPMVCRPRNVDSRQIREYRSIRPAGVACWATTEMVATAPMTLRIDPVTMSVSASRPT
mmetsp:Transcript_25795/g.79569  ORF Transcript_25795/g.79569 Transcript_25795/m.79569 type:complete len:210 (-) Transcript_25795:485-1114(-)